LHPALRILLYLVSALALPGLNFFSLVVCTVILPLLFPARLSAMLRLAWRAKWLFILIGLGYAYSLPGPAVWSGLGDYSPSTPGLEASAVQMLRLLLLLWLLDALVVSMGAQRMMTGLHGVFGSLRGLGLPAERMTVRLALTLQAMERNVLSPARLPDRLRGIDAPTTDTDLLAFQLEPWFGRDTLILIAALAGLVLAWLA
jgi:energy-coupling factor transporter transmembrane protein EcfT